MGEAQQALDQCQTEMKAAIHKAMAAGVEAGEVVTLMIGFLGIVCRNLSPGRRGQLIRLIVEHLSGRDRERG